MAKVWIVYDARAKLGNTDDAQVLDTCNSLDEARDTVKKFYPDGVIAEYDLVSDELGSLEAVNEKIIK